MNGLQVLAEVATNRAGLVRVDDGETFDVEAVTKVIYRRNGTPFKFFVEWTGYGREHDCWITDRHLHCTAEEFCVQHGFRPRKRMNPRGPMLVCRKQ